jgi:hypothetical protein
MSGPSLCRLTVLCLGSAALAGLALIVPAHKVKAEQVGVAAAVKPDAFSEGKEVKIGNSVFYNQRINTTGEGLVQVLLVDGSTFTVGPGSDLVIDKFVYDPAKKQGEVVASFSKGVLRFVGGKISKNEGGVTVNTPSGALAIRGGMFQGTPNLFSFLFGVEMKWTGKNGQVNRVYTPGYTLDLRGGGAGNVRPTTPEDTAFFMKALSGGGTVVVATPNGVKPNITQNFFKHIIIADITQEGTQTIINDQLNNEEHHVENNPPPTTEPPSQPPAGGPPSCEETNTCPPPPPPPCEETNTCPPPPPPPSCEETNTCPPPPPPPSCEETNTCPPPPDEGSDDGAPGGYVAGTYVEFSDNSFNNPNHNNDDHIIRVGSAASLNRDDVTVTFDQGTQTFTGAKFTLFGDQGGAAKIEFVPFQPVLTVSQDSHLETVNQRSQLPFFDLAEDATLLGVAAVGHGDNDNFNFGSIEFFHDTDTSSGDPKPTNPEQVNAGVAGLWERPSGQLCDNCEFIKWGQWALFADHANDNEDGSKVTWADGYWVTGNLTSTAELGDLRNSGATASYSGKAWASVANNLDGEGWSRYKASGNMDMDWSFAARKGNLTISNFDSTHIVGGLTFQGQMQTPGELLKNKFSGPLALTSQNIPANLSDVQGFAQGSFVKGPDHPAQGVVGNWGAGGANYGATGVFGGSKVVPTQ